MLGADVALKAREAIAALGAKLGSRNSKAVESAIDFASECVERWSSITDQGERRTLAAQLDATVANLESIAAGAVSRAIWQAVKDAVGDAVFAAIRSAI